MQQGTASAIPTSVTQETVNNLATGIRQRSSYASEQPSEKRAPTPVERESSDMSTARAVVLTVSVLGVLSFSVFAVMFGARYPFFGFHGNMEEATTSCWQTAILFGVVAIFAIFPSVTNAVGGWRRAHSLHKKHVLPGAYRR